MGNRNRLYYYVEDSSSGWTLAVHEEPAWLSPIDYSTRDEAMAAALHLALQDWVASGRPTGVRVRYRPDARWEERTFGGDTGVLASAAE